MNQPAVPLDDQNTVVQNCMWTHIVPFAAWLVLMTLWQPPSAIGYAARTVICGGLFIWFKPWRWYEAPKWKYLPLAIVVGIAVCIIWIFPETPFARQSAFFDRFYQIVGIMPIWKAPEVVTESPYAPEVCGWLLTGIRIFGMTVVVALIEEFFWRAFLYRWMSKDNFLNVDPGVFRLWPFLGMSLLFGIEHNRWFVGILAGMIYGYLYIRTRDIWTVVIAHGVTNCLLGIYAVQTASYAFL